LRGNRMNSSQQSQLAEQFITNTVKVKKNENVWIEYWGPEARKLADACAEKAREAGGIPFLDDQSAATIDTIELLSEEEIRALGKEKLARMETMQCCVRIKDTADQEKLTLSAEKRVLYQRALETMTQWRINNTRWLVVVAPSKEFAADCGMSVPDFERFYCDVCLTDYRAMSEAVKPLQKLMTEGKTVYISSPAQETDLTFSIEGIPAVSCTGQWNIPDGECYTAPVKNSVNGTITFGPSSYQGERFAFIKLTLKDGHIEKAEAEHPERTTRLNEILDIDPGARYAGEFSINFHPLIKHPTGCIHFDEKIDGGIHLAWGRCYQTASNGNQSANHWDMVHIQRPDYGGGELFIDDRLIRKDGVFVVPELMQLNPDNLKAVSKLH
jgi:aminopeptidase